MIQRDQLGDESAHRRADDVRGGDAERVQEAYGVGGHIVQPVLTLHPRGMS